MSLTQTYYLAHTARAKLSKEAARGDHNLRLLVGHANLLDGLMIDLVEAEQTQEALFNTQTRHVSFAPEPRREPTIIEDYEEDEDEDSDSDSDDEEPTVFSALRQSIAHAPTHEDDEQYSDDEDYEHLALVRTSSHSSPPELLHESDEESDDEVMPPSPPAPAMSFPSVVSKKNATETISHSAAEEALYEEGYWLPTRSTAPSLAVY